jgi:hypothetical protein
MTESVSDFLRHLGLHILDKQAHYLQVFPLQCEVQTTEERDMRELMLRRDEGRRGHVQRTDNRRTRKSHELARGFPV